MKVSKNFHIKEFVPSQIYSQWGAKSIWFVDPKIIDLAQCLRDKYGPMVINGAFNGQTYNYSGFRPMTTSIGGKLSQHRFGRAIDCKFKEHKVQDVYQDILEDSNYWMKKGLTTLEDIRMTPTWLHCDIRTTLENDIKIVRP